MLDVLGIEPFELGDLKKFSTEIDMALSHLWQCASILTSVTLKSVSRLNLFTSPHAQTYVLTTLAFSLLPFTKPPQY
jgi:hypothetical protein